jgi:hypothetical protein
MTTNEKLLSTAVLAYWGYALAFLLGNCAFVTGDLDPDDITRPLAMVCFYPTHAIDNEFS